MNVDLTDELQTRMDVAIDAVLDLLEEASVAGVELNPLQTILRRLQARGNELDLSEADPMTRMLLSGMIDS